MDNNFSYSLDIFPFGLLNEDDLLGWLIIGHHRILYIYSGRQLRDSVASFMKRGYLTYCHPYGCHLSSY